MLICVLFCFWVCPLSCVGFEIDHCWLPRKAKEAAKLAKAKAKAQAKGRGKGRRKGRAKGRGKGRAKGPVPCPQSNDLESESERGEHEVQVPEQSPSEHCEADAEQGLLEQDEVLHVSEHPAEHHEADAEVLPHVPEQGPADHREADVEQGQGEPEHVEQGQPDEPDVQNPEPGPGHLDLDAAEGPQDARPRAVGHVSAREFSTPAIMQNLSPPLCTLCLDVKAHRFAVKFKQRPNPDTWVGLNTMSYNKAFNSIPWVDALKDVHREAWDRWKLAKDQPAFHLPPDKVQTPGHVSQEVIDALEDVISKLPPAVKYAKHS